MKQLLKSLSAFTASASIAVCSMTSGLTCIAETEEKNSYTLHYDLSEEGVTIPEDEDGNVQELKDISLSPNSSVFLTDIIPEKEGYSFSGWTEDYIRGYEASDVFRISDKDVTLHPVWVDKNDKEFHTISYKVIIDGVEDEDAKLRVPDKKLLSGRIFKVPLDVFNNPGYKQRGWTDGVNEFLPETKLVVNDKDITLYPNYKKMYNLIYTVGDADRINGVTKLEFEIAEGDSTNIQSNTRFSRNGFKMSKWHCETDGKDYDPNSYFEMPGNDVIMMPIWEPIRYVVVFKQNSNSSDNIKVPGYTDTAIVAPECTVVNGNSKFKGWQRGDLIIQPGEEYVIPGAEPGMGIAFTAVWASENEGETTTTTSKVTTTTTTTTTSTTTTSTTSSPSVTTTAIPPYSYVVKAVDKETGELVNDANFILSWDIRYELNGEVITSGPLQAINTADANPAVISFEKYKDAKVVSLAVRSMSQHIYYTFDENDISYENDDVKNIHYYTVKLTKRAKPEIPNGSYTVTVVDKETGKAVHDAAIIGKETIILDDGREFTGNVDIDTSKYDPYVFIPAIPKSAKSYTFGNFTSKDGRYTFTENDVTAEKDKETEITSYTIKVTPAKVAYGDANCDGTIDMSDVVLIMQALANPNKYDVNGTDANHITAIGRTNADVWNSGDGVTTQDALHIQKYLLGLCEITAKVEVTASPE